MKLEVPPERPASRGWYLVAFGLIGTALAIAWTGFNQMREVVATMQRRQMPGTAELALAGGRASIYYEHASRFDHKDYATPPDLAVSCTLRSPNGTRQPLQPAAGKVTYSSEEWAGRKIYDAEIVAPGSYTLSCDGREPYVLAIGGGIGAWNVVALVGLLLPGTAGLIVIVMVTLKRRRWFARQKPA